MAASPHGVRVGSELYLCERSDGPKELLVGHWIVGGARWQDEFTRLCFQITHESRALSWHRAYISAPDGDTAHRLEVHP